MLKKISTKQQIFGKIIGNHVEFRSREKIDFKSPSPSSNDDFSWVKGASKVDVKFGLNDLMALYMAK